MLIETSSAEGERVRGEKVGSEVLALTTSSGSSRTQNTNPFFPFSSH